MGEGDTASLPPGLKLADYVIERPLGGGGFGITYLARDSNLQLPVAIKEYYPSELVSRAPDHSVSVRTTSTEHREQYDWGLERFLDEARALATFRHPNIVRVLRYFREHGTAYIVMEYESGLPLKRWVPHNLPLTRKAVLGIVEPLLDGLEAVHNSGFLHRDIKPDNIYVRADGTPVLLDFGAARRVSADKDMTNIVSPGFAPFEQYHSQGNQGPWTDIYSIGAVMYWMTTGRKPAESASRVKQDTMLPATSLAEASVFGESLLKAIDWALHPDEGKRPQTVAAFREAVRGPAKEDASGATQVDVEIQFEKSNAPTSPPTTSPSQRRNLLGTIMFLDVVGYSKRSVTDQVAVKKMFNDMLGSALKTVPEDSRIAIDTGDGAAVCFMGDPEEALNAAMLLRDLLSHRRAFTVRAGLHMGPVRVVNDFNERVNVVGDGINVAQRVMDFAEGNQILVSRAYYDVISRITDDTKDLFQYMGQYEDKHGRQHEIHAVVHRGSTPTTRRQGPSTGYTQTLPVRAAQPLDGDEVHEIEAELARHIGPLAKVLVRKAAPRAGTVQQLREALAPSIQEPKARDSFVTGGHGVSHPPSQPVSSRRGPASGSMPLSKPSSTTGGYSKLAPNPKLELEPQEFAVVEQHLSRLIGPMAKMIARKEAARQTSFKEFVAAVAATVDNAGQREQFVQAIRRALPARH